MCCLLMGLSGGNVTDSLPHLRVGARDLTYNFVPFSVFFIYIILRSTWSNRIIPTAPLSEHDGMCLVAQKIIMITGRWIQQSLTGIYIYSSPVSPSASI